MGAIQELGLVKAFLRGLMPDDIITVSEWADRYRILPMENAVPGRFKIAKTPYLEEIADRLSVTDPAIKVILMSGSQIGKTELGNNWLGYVVDVSPAPFLYVMPTDAMIKKTSKTRIQKMFDLVPRLRAKVNAQKSRESGNTITEKYFEGGSLTMIGANSPVGLASTSIRFVYMDEVDRYPLNVGGEGSALKLAETRTATFGNSKKIFITSTPTLKGTSQVDNEFEKTSQRYYFVPCPFCGHKQILLFSQLRYERGNYEDVKFECAECKELIEERHKTWMMKKGNGEWRATVPELENKYMYGYHVSSMYSPVGMYSWASMAKDYEDSIGNIPETISFINTKLGVCYEPQKGDRPEWEMLYNRYHNEENKYEANKPKASVTFITIGVDVQADRIEYMVTGWMKGKLSQMIDYQVIVGSTDQDEVWKELNKVVNRTWIREDNHVIPMRLMAIDTGYNTKKVYDFVKQHQMNRVVPVKGLAKLDMIFSAPKAVQVSKAGKKVGEVKVFGVGVSLIKSELYGWLKQGIDLETGEIPQGYCYFLPKEATFFRGLVAEELIRVENKKGFYEHVWIKKYERNEPLDTFVYARAAAAIVGMDRWDDERWNQELLVSGTPVELSSEKASSFSPTVKKKSPFWDR
jgi:phage terminase large subunit GpA-like protein